MLSTEVDLMKNMGVLPHDKNLLQNQILNGEFPLLREVKLTKYKIS
jgi:hypothetical protein